MVPEPRRPPHSFFLGAFGVLPLVQSLAALIHRQN
jgi:hypothetical protein